MMFGFFSIICCCGWCLGISNAFFFFLFSLLHYLLSFLIVIFANKHFVPHLWFCWFYATYQWMYIRYCRTNSILMVTSNNSSDESISNNSTKKLFMWYYCCSVKLLCLFQLFLNLKYAQKIKISVLFDQNTTAKAQQSIYKLKRQQNFIRAVNMMIFVHVLQKTLDFVFCCVFVIRSM